MKYENAIFRCIKYIEKNIKEELTAEIIAKEMGYSVYHFSRIFKEQMGMSLMEYVKERRLVCASKDIFIGNKIIDISIEYGYKTHSGFSKAFKKKFGFAPTVIHAIRMSCNLLNENGGRKYMSNDERENTNLFIQQSEDFTEPVVLYKQLVASVRKNNLFNDLSRLEKAYDMASKVHEGEYRKSGEPYITHPLCVAIILAEVESDEESIIAGLLHEVIEKDTIITLQEVEKEFPGEVAKLIDEVTTLTQIDLDEKYIGNSAEDTRVILIKLADRLHNMRTIKYMEPDRWREKAKETIEIFSPLAARLGISKIKTELDDLALIYL